MLRYSPETLEPGMLIVRSKRPSDNEVSRRAQIGATMSTQPLHNCFRDICDANKVVNRMVSLSTWAGDFSGPSEQLRGYMACSTSTATLGTTPRARVTKE